MDNNHIKHNHSDLFNESLERILKFLTDFNILKVIFKRAFAHNN